MHAEAAPITIVPANDDRDRAIRLRSRFLDRTANPPSGQEVAWAKINHMIAEQAPGISFH